MNTIETERLVRRIVATLKGEGDPTMAPKLAADFQAACTSVALRLEQCRSMIDAGASVQAIQAAETPPNLLDLVTILEFRQADEWRQFCSSKNLPCPETLPARDVSALNTCYNRGISPQHPIYATYRAAMLAGNDVDALQALKSIVRLNPSDSNAASELARLDASMLATRLAKLEGLLATDPDGALHEVNDIEAFGFKSELAGELWQRAQLARSGKLLAEGEQLKREGLLAETVARLDFLAQLRTDNKLTWPPEWENRVGILREWCRAEAEARQQDEDYHAAMEQVNQAILASAAKETRAEKVSIHEHKADLEELHRRYSLAASFSRPIPEELTERFKERSAFIRQKIKKLALVRNVVAVAGTTAVVLVLAVMGLAFLGLHRANSLAEEINKATAAHQVRSLQALLKQTGSRTTLQTPNLRSVSAAAGAEVASQMALLSEFEKAYKKLPANLASVTDAKQLIDVLGDFNRAEQAHGALSSDLQTETEAELAAFSRRWQDYCGERLAFINKELDGRIAADESTVSTLDDLKDLDHFRSIISEKLPQLEEIKQEISALEPALKVQPELANRCQALSERLHNDQAKLDALDTALATLSHASKPGEVAAVVTDLAAIDLKQSDYVRAARKAGAVAALKDDPENLSRALLVGTNSTGWETLSKNGNGELIPGKFGSNVRSRFMALTRDYAVNARHFRCRLYRDPQLKAFEEWITDGPLMTDASWHSIPAWEVKDEGPCEFAMKDYGFFQNQYQFSDRQPAYGVTVTDINALTDVWQGSGFAKLMDTRNLTYKLPPLEVVDAIFEDDKASPIFRAYLLNELLRFMAAQPLESGLFFSPKVRQFPEQLDALGVDQIKSGDWFVPARVNAVQSKYAEFFAARRGASYFKQAVTFLNATTRAMKSGFVLAGYAGLDGKPVWTSAPGDNLVWGLSESASQPELLFKVRGGENQELAKPLPLTPLLVFQGDLSVFIKDSGVRSDDPSLKGQLPPIFSAASFTP
ncbi:MAG: hypothetical protein P4M10_04830 [Verrucomicrobiae bacterium]|nr:hypothetical protein [Verrucomicrobiae bacterium]